MTKHCIQSYTREISFIVQTCVQLPFDRRQVHWVLNNVKVILEENNVQNNVLKSSRFWKLPS